MKILHVMHNSQLDTGGKISHNLLLQGLDDTGITNEVISTEEYDGFRTHIMEDHMDVNRLRKRDQLVASEVDRVLGEVDADVLYTSGYYALPGSLLAAEDQDITTVTHYRDYWPCCVNGTLIADDETYHERCSVATILRHNSLKRAPWNLYKWQYLKGLAPLLRGADHTIATSSSVADRLGAWGIEAEVVPNPVQIEQYQGDRDEHDGFVAGFIGSLEPMKGTDLLTELIEEHPEVQFRVAGIGSQEERLRERFSERENVEFLGWVDREDVGAFYRSLDVTLYPSLVPEGFGRVAVESMAAGTPVLASGRGGLTDIVRTAQDGYLLDPEDADAWSTALDALREDDGLREQQSVNARERATAFTLNKHVDKFLDVIQ